eukprot:XP_015581325.1 uncharacterized protein LOC107262106 [Ricinus communis]
MPINNSTNTAIIPSLSSLPISTLPNIAHQLAIKLNSINYLLLEAHILSLLDCYDLTKHVDGTIDPPPKLTSNDQPNLAYNVCFHQDELVLSWIIGSISENFVPQIVGVSNTKMAWQKLVSTYASGSKAHIWTIILKFYQLIKESNKSVAQYTQCAKSMFDQLAKLDSPVNKDDLLQVVVNGLVSTYHAFVRSLTKKLVVVCFDDLYDLLLSEEENFAANTSMDTSSIIAPTTHIATNTQPTQPT